MSIDSSRPHAFSGSDIAVLQEMAVALSEGFHRLEDLKQLAEERQRLAVTLRSIGDCVIAIDAEGRIVLLNRVVETLTGWTQDESRGRYYAEVFTLEQTSPHEDPVAHVLETGTVLTVVPPTLKAMDSAERLVSTSSVPIRDDEGKTIGAVLVSRDVSEQRKIAMDLSPDDELYANLTEVEDALTARYGSHASVAGVLEAWGPCQEGGFDRSVDHRLGDFHDPWIECPVHVRDRGAPMGLRGGCRPDQSGDPDPGIEC